MVSIARRTIGLMLAAAVMAPPISASAEQDSQTVKIGDLSKAGYQCKEVGPEAHLCTRGKEDPKYGCQQWECKPIARIIGGSNVRAPIGGVLRR